MVKKLRNIQEKDSLCNTYPRFKKGDDSTIVYLEIKIWKYNYFVTITITKICYNYFNIFWNL